MDDAGASPAAKEHPPGVVVFLTGISGAGKTTIARALAGELNKQGGSTSVIDGDELRQTVTPDLGFDRPSRVANAEQAARRAVAEARVRDFVIVALIAPFEEARTKARAIVEAAGHRFLLVWVKTPLTVAERRDPKGLYRRARAGELPDFTGISSAFEEPTSPDLVIPTDALTIADGVRRILADVTRGRQTDPERQVG